MLDTPAPLAVGRFQGPSFCCIQLGGWKLFTLKAGAGWAIVQHLLPHHWKPVRCPDCLPQAELSQQEVDRQALRVQTAKRATGLRAKANPSAHPPILPSLYHRCTRSLPHPHLSPASSSFSFFFRQSYYAAQAALELTK